MKSENSWFVSSFDTRKCMCGSLSLEVHLPKIKQMRAVVIFKVYFQKLPFPNNVKYNQRLHQHNHSSTTSYYKKGHPCKTHLTYHQTRKKKNPTIIPRNGASAYARKRLRSARFTKLMPESQGTG